MVAVSPISPAKTLVNTKEEENGKLFTENKVCATQCFPSTTAVHEHLRRRHPEAVISTLNGSVLELELS